VQRRATHPTNLAIQAKGRHGRESGGASRQAGRKAGRQEGRKAGRQEGRKAGRQEGRKAGRQIGRQAGRQADTSKRWQHMPSWLIPATLGWRNV
jgi:flagellar biosynthesis/type III secretory pathway protein FliH